MRRIKRRILWDSEDSVCVSCCGVELMCCLERLEVDDAKGRHRHIEVDGC
jgi:hypothetical protein